MLEFGKKYTYKGLCKALDIPVQSAGYKQNQLKALGRKYEIKTVGDRYIVKRELNDYEVAKTSKNKYQTYIEPILYTLLYQAKRNVIRVDMRDLLVLTATVNKDYHFAKWHIEKVDNELTDGSNNGLKEFILETEPMYRATIRKVLRDMEDKKLIEIEKIPMYGKKVTVNGNEVYTQRIEASEEEGRPVFLEACRQAMKKWGYTHWSQMELLSYNEYDAVKREIEKYLKEKLDVDFFYFDYKLILNKDGIKDEMVTLNFEDMRNGLNECIMNKTIKSKAGKLKFVDPENKVIYTEALININNDLHLRDKLKG